MSHYLIERLPKQYDIARLWDDCLRVVDHLGGGPGNPPRQVCLTHRAESPDRWFEGAGGLVKGHKEKDYCILSEFLEGSYVEEIFRSLPFKIGRFRLLRMPPRTCYSVHRDGTKRFHVPLITNPQALMLFPDNGVIEHLPADGHAYMTDTTQRHTAMNGGLSDRYHLVGALWEEE